MSALESEATRPSLALDGMTAEEFLEFCANDGYFELIRGEVVQLAPASSHHGFIITRLILLLGEYVVSHELGELFSSETGFILEENPSTVRCPDVSFVRKERLPEELPEEFFPGAPDFAVEVLSPTDSIRAAEAKIRMYQRAGTTLAWILNPHDLSVRVYRPGPMTQRFGPEDEIDAEPLLPGFRCIVFKLFGRRSPRRTSSSKG